MPAPRDEDFGFAPPHDAPIPYLQRIHDYYIALGYGAPYQWAHYAQVPFTRLGKPLSACRITIVTTAAPVAPGKGEQGPWAPYNAEPKFYSVYALDSGRDHELAVSHVAVDFKHTSREDARTFLPLPALREAARRGRIGEVAPRVLGIPTNRSHRVTLGIDCPELLTRCKADAVDAAILVPNCPVCHQTTSLAARLLEENGIATVVMGCVKDIVEYVGVPRLLFSDFPLGNGAGRPHDPASQSQTLELALSLIEAAPGPRTTVQSPLRWSDDPDWKLDYSNAARMTPEEIAAKRAEFDAQKAIATRLRDAQGLGRKKA